MDKKLYLSPSGLYYKEVIEGNKVSYEVAGKYPVLHFNVPRQGAIMYF